MLRVQEVLKAEAQVLRCLAAVLALECLAGWEGNQTLCLCTLHQFVSLYLCVGVTHYKGWLVIRVCVYNST